ncbi:hypothetical protein DYD21_11000 [Rhodohalobacter sp. SW132]|uniref:hypothetical protein n=1 Tax=Rhodohalobacter sp. SW132 TaxID=2293433 RepID=UPI000E251A14|nr:hypothetical protein [Rhodohalobacter sp. SW132]REL33301.1 hypothetical protein DYD21_11000 [Rhodohalobacter sp. SW132]
MKSTQRKTVKRIFIFFLCYLPIQYGLVGVIGYYQAEPWPAFVFPGFKNVYVYDGHYAVNQFFIEVSHPDQIEPTRLTLQTFFDDMPLSMIPAFMRSNLSDQEYVNTFSDETLDWFNQRASEKTGRETNEIQMLHERSFMQRTADGLEQDSVQVIQRVQILRGE